jgi:uncharacterized protein (DUF1800 family)
MQLLNRLTFGPRPGDVQLVQHMGIDQWIDHQLHPERIDDREMDQVLSHYTLLNQDQNDLAHEYADFVQLRKERRAAKQDTTSAMTADDSLAFKQMNLKRVQLVEQLKSSRVARSVASQRQLLEVMTDFWENHFNVYVQKGAVEPYYLVDYDRTIREHALGKFRDLLGAVAHSPAMLFYLDNTESQANPGQPTLGQWRERGRIPLFQNYRRTAQQTPGKISSGLNENYGRELLELHTLGVDAGYTQQDVINVARAFTGWSIQPPKQGGGFIFRPVWHDAAEKVVLGHNLPANRGEDDGEDVLDIIAKHPATAHFIALKLARRFVSDSPSTALVNRAAQRFLRTGGDIREVIRTIVTSPEFFSERTYRAKVKSPFEVVVSAARALNAQPDTTARTALAVAYLGEPIFGHQAPDGWPERGAAWINTGAILNRINFGMSVAANRLPGASIMNLPGADSLQHASRDHQIDAVVQNILGGNVSPEMRHVLLSGKHPLASGVAEETQTTSAGMVPARPINSSGMGPPPGSNSFAQVVGLAIGSPEFQRR